MNSSANRMAPLVLAALLLCPTFTLAQELKAIQLLDPQMDGGRPLMRVFKDRVSSRSFSPEKLPMQMLSNMLWAAFGVNRPASGGRTALSASNSQEMDIYVAMADGLEDSQHERPPAAVAPSVAPRHLTSQTQPPPAPGADGAAPVSSPLGSSSGNPPAPQ